MIAKFLAPIGWIITAPASTRARGRWIVARSNPRIRCAVPIRALRLECGVRLIARHVVQPIDRNHAKKMMAE